MKKSVPNHMMFQNLIRVNRMMKALLTMVGLLFSLTAVQSQTVTASAPTPNTVCYEETFTVAFNLAGFAAGETVTVTLDLGANGSSDSDDVTIDGSGNGSGSVTVSYSGTASGSQSLSLSAVGTTNAGPIVSNNVNVNATAPVLTTGNVEPDGPFCVGDMVEVAFTAQCLYPSIGFTSGVGQVQVRLTSSDKSYDEELTVLNNEGSVDGSGDITLSGTSQLMGTVKVISPAGVEFAEDYRFTVETVTGDFTSDTPGAGNDDGDQEIRSLVIDAWSDPVDWLGSCGPSPDPSAAAAEPAVPVPALSLWGVGILAGLLACLGVSQRRRRH